MIAKTRILLIAFVTMLSFIQRDLCIAQGCGDNSIGILDTDQNGQPIEVTWWGGNSGCDDRPWFPVFTEEFEGTNLNSDYWYIQSWELGNPSCESVNIDYSNNCYDFYVGYEDCPWYRTPQECLRSGNVEVSNGTLKLIAKQELVPANEIFYYDGATNSMLMVDCNRQYSSGRIQSKYDYLYGVIEMRCKFPNFTGMFPAFWMFGRNENYQALTDYNPDFIQNSLILDNEIDIFEGEEIDRAKMSLHLWYKGEYCYSNGLFQNVCNGGVNEEKLDFVIQDNYCGPNFNDEWHYFSVEWTPFNLYFYIDGQPRAMFPKFTTLQGQILDCNSDLSASAIRNHRMFPMNAMGIIANLAILGDYPAPDLSNPTNATFEIDYIKYYGKVECGDRVFNDLSWTNYGFGFNQPTDYLNEPNLFRYITGENITMGGNMIIPNNFHVSLHGSETINFEPGFSTGTGTLITTELVDLPCSSSGMILANSNTIGTAAPYILEDSPESIVTGYNLSIEEDSFNLETDQSINEMVVMNIEVYNTNGQIVYSGPNIQWNLKELNNTLSTGEYLVKYVDSYGTLVKFENLVIVK